jgi:tetratricopeptide (TPR) repeat protein
MQTYEALGDRRSRAATLGDIARIMTNKGNVEQALKILREQAEICDALGNQDGIAAANFAIGQLLLNRAIEHSDAAAFQAAYEALAASYGIFLRIGRLDGICAVGGALGRVLAMAGQHDEARAVLTRSRDGYQRLGRDREVAFIEDLLRRIG